MTFKRFIASLFGIGYLPLAPATWASAVVIVILYFIRVDWFYLLPAIVVLFFAGTWLANEIIKKYKVLDPRYFVFDELVGMMISVLFLPRTVLWYFLAFFLFRVLDIIKPSPVRESEKVRMGWGVMLDDLLAGGYTVLLLNLARWGLKL